ncbi:CCAAT-binding factor complex subunit Php4 [Schizosaccharomyces japonicus yFS275]|uniref:CCAAT-binding factor complex subunit Php4 n=1 Tax=Schizosaccharomyces japonicus (strain yFS275 / FY16936) TaxID=402676 RepID=B6K798_SCHJY|nr:CCAAT-binding factor complex subunit Php4 [Schizosaccharomyces japonicus yFS275]EEB09402.1 CCAAT-binding factor complex subunit Php4 [Schizosaccharomyces japonicus yFS275]
MATTSSTSRAKTRASSKTHTSSNKTPPAASPSPSDPSQSTAGNEVVPQIRISKHYVLPPRPKPGRKPALDANGRRKTVIKPKPSLRSARPNPSSLEGAQFLQRERQYQAIIDNLQQEKQSLIELVEDLRRQLQQLNAGAATPEPEVHSPNLKEESLHAGSHPHSSHVENYQIQKLNVPVQPPCTSKSVYTEVPIEHNPYVYLGQSKRFCSSHPSTAPQSPRENSLSVFPVDAAPQRVALVQSPKASDSCSNKRRPMEIDFTTNGAVANEYVRKYGMCTGLDRCIYSTNGPIQSKQSSPCSNQTQPAQAEPAVTDETKAHAKILMELHNSVATNSNDSTPFTVQTTSSNSASTVTSSSMPVSVFQQDGPSIKLPPIEPRCTTTIQYPDRRCPTCHKSSPALDFCRKLAQTSKPPYASNLPIACQYMPSGQEHQNGLGLEGLATTQTSSRSIKLDVQQLVNGLASSSNSVQSPPLDSLPNHH